MNQLIINQLITGGPHPVVSHIVRRVGDLLSVIFWRQYGVPILTTHQFLFVLFTMLSWLVVWNMFLFFHIWIIIPTDLLIFFRGVGSTTSEWTSAYLMIPILSIPSGNQNGLEIPPTVWTSMDSCRFSRENQSIDILMVTCGTLCFQIDWWKTNPPFNLVIFLYRKASIRISQQSPCWHRPRPISGRLLCHLTLRCYLNRNMRRARWSKSFMKATLCITRGRA